jgi:hypothetical protein
MKALVSVACVVLAAAGLPTTASAACAAPAVRVNKIDDLTKLLRGNTVCVGSAPTFDSQELHQDGGALIDYKRGPADKVDPSTNVGTWSITGNDTRGVFVKYTYSGGSSYTYSVWSNGGDSYSFCSSQPEIRARLKPGGGSC